MKRNILKRFVAILLMTGVSLSIGGCSVNEENSVQTIRDAGIVKVAIVTEMNSTDAGEMTLVESIAGALGVQAEYLTVSTKELALHAVSEGTADFAIGHISNSSTLEEQYLASNPYGTGSIYVVTEHGDHAKTIGAFSGSDLGVMDGLGEDSKEALNHLTNVSVKAYSDSESAVWDVKNGNIRAFICYQKQAEDLLADPDVQVQNLTNLAPEEFVIVAEKTDQTLIGGINTMIQQYLEKE